MSFKERLYTTLPAGRGRVEGISQEQSHSLYELCKQIEDKRAARGKQYDLAGLRMVLVMAKLAGMKSLIGASDWVRDQAERLREHFHLSWKHMPCANTYKYALARLDSQQINEQFRDWLVRKEAERWCGAEPSRLAGQAEQRAVRVAIDGKVLKGTDKQAYGGEKPQKHVLHVYEVQTGIVLHQCPIAEKQNEVSALKPLLTEMLCKGRILTTDAAQSYHEFGRQVKRAGGDVIPMVKDNTPQTRADLELFFEDPQADRSTWHSYERVEKGHGRLERRQLLSTPDLNEYLDREWGEVGQVFRLQRERTSSEKSSVEVIYGLTTLSREQCSALSLDPSALVRRKSPPRAPRCHPGERPMWGSRSSYGSYARRAQFLDPFLNGWASVLQCGSPDPALFTSS